MECPKCSYKPTTAEHAASPEICPKCGAVYAKVKARQEQGAEQVQRKEPIAEPAPAPRSMPAGIVGADAAMAEDRQRLAGRKAGIPPAAAEDGRGEHAAKPVVITGVDIPFLPLVVLVTKIILAAIPGTLLVWLIWFVAASGWVAHSQRVQEIEQARRELDETASRIRSELRVDQAAARADYVTLTSMRSPRDYMVTSACSSIKRLAGTVMRARVFGIPKEDVMSILREEPGLSIGSAAYQASDTSSARFSLAREQECLQKYRQ